jgi:hypothetical protein
MASVMECKNGKGCKDSRFCVEKLNPSLVKKIIGGNEYYECTKSMSEMKACKFYK